MIVRLFRPIQFPETENRSLESFDNFLGTSHDAETYPKGPQTSPKEIKIRNAHQHVHQHFHHIYIYMIIIHDQDT